MKPSVYLSLSLLSVCLSVSVSVFSLSICLSCSEAGNDEGGGVSPGHSPSPSPCPGPSKVSKPKDGHMHRSHSEDTPGRATEVRECVREVGEWVRERRVYYGAVFTKLIRSLTLEVNAFPLQPQTEGYLYCCCSLSLPPSLPPSLPFSLSLSLRVMPPGRRRDGYRQPKTADIEWCPEHRARP